MKYKIALLNILLTAIALGSTPPKPGVIPSDVIIRQNAIMAESYGQGGLADKIRRVKAANLQAAETGRRDLRENVYGSFPVIMGSYNDSNDDPSTVNDLQRQLFGDDWPTVTMAEHYEQMSYGQYHLSGTVYGWFELSQTGYHYGGTDNGWDGGVLEFLTESLDLSDIDIDFGQYDNDGEDGIPNSGDDDGKVDVVFFVHSGPGGEGGAANIWSHRWNYRYASGNNQAYETNDTSFSAASGTGKITIEDYIIQPAVSSSQARGLIEIGVFSHEFGHALGLPDLYDTNGGSNSIGSWCLMASGSWSSPTSPVHLSAWCKEMLGWTIPIVVDQNEQNVEIPNAEEQPFALKLWTHGQIDPYVGSYSHGQSVGEEYYLIENRQRIGTEQSLPGTGLVVWHIDNTRSTNSNENHRMVDIKPADGHIDGSNSGDSWPGSTNNRNFDFETMPSSVGWAGVNTEVAVLNVSDSDSIMWADIEVYETNPNLGIADMLISDFNGDQIYAPGENVLIWLIVENIGGLASNITATLSLEGSAVELVDSVITFNPIDFLGTSQSNQAFEFNISDTLSPGPVNFTVTFTADEALELEQQAFSLLLGLPEIVLMDDDGVLSGGLDYQSYFTDALESSELVHVVWDIAESGLPELDWLDDFPAVIWFSGDNPAPLNLDRTSLIAGYLDGGGNILMTGQNMATGDMTVTNFVSDYFALEVLSSDISTANVYGDPGHEFFDINDRFAIGCIEGANNQTAADSYTIHQEGSSIFMYPLLGGTSCGSSVKNETYSAVMLGFGLEALTQFEGESPSSRGVVIERLLTWLATPSTAIAGTAPFVPETLGVTASYPNPFNPAVTFDIRLSTGDRGVLQILNIRGGLVETLELQQSGQMTWTPSGSLAGGVYFARFQMNGKTVGSLEKITFLK